MTTNRLEWELRRMFIIAGGAFIGLSIGAIMTPNNFPNGSAMPPLIMIGLTALCAAAAFVTHLVFNPKPKDDAPAGTTTTAAAPAAPELDRQISEIVNSGKEPSLIVEELRQLTTGR